MPVGNPAEILRLRVTLRDLVALSTVPAAWVGREPSVIAAGLADVLMRSLGLRFAFVRLCDPAGFPAVEVMRGNGWKGFPEWLQQHLSLAGMVSHKEIIPDSGNGAEPHGGIVVPIGVNAEGGLVAAVCDDTGFPDEDERLLLSVAANTAGTAFQNARLIDKLRSAQQALEKARSELEVKVGERTSELRRSEAYLAEAQTLAHTGSWAWKVATREVIHWSDECFRLYGFDRKRGLPSWEEWDQRLHPEDRNKRRETVHEAIRQRADYELDNRIVLPDGTIRHIHSVAHPVFSASGDLMEFVGTAMDVTEHKRAEEERETLRQAQADLAHISRVTTMGELTATMAHEIKQPIAAAVTDANTCLRWLKRDKPDQEEACEAASRVVMDVTRAADIINRIRLLSKKDVPERELVDVNEVIQEMMVLLRNEATRYSISIRVELAEKLPKIMADRVQLQQVLMNLMLNGIEAMNGVSPAGMLTIKSREEYGHLLISVSDTGVGLPPERPNQIFDAFFTTKSHGTGMGLPISRSIIESHGGRLWAADNSGHGATLHFTLPSEVPGMRLSPVGFRIKYQP
jgi:PAS domain S-box-containing protein